MFTVSTAAASVTGGAHTPETRHHSCHHPQAPPMEWVARLVAPGIGAPLRRHWSVRPVPGQEREVTGPVRQIAWLVVPARSLAAGSRKLATAEVAGVGWQGRRRQLCNHQRAPALLQGSYTLRMSRLGC